MIKNKVVIFNKDNGGAKVFTTENPDEVGIFPNEIKLVNPDLSFVADIPPELWNLENDKIVPLFDADAIKKRMAEIGIRSFTNQADQEVKGNIHKLVDIPERVESLEYAFFGALERQKKDLIEDSIELRNHITTQVGAQIKHQEVVAFEILHDLTESIEKTRKLIVGVLIGLVLAILILLVHLFIK